MPEELKVQIDELDVFRQIVGNWNSPLELIREAISNSYDAGANNIEITIKRRPWQGNQRWIVTIRDDGAGMVETPKEKPNDYTVTLEDFFKLGGSSRKNNVGYTPVGEKCLGIKLTFHSSFLRVKTWAGDGFPVLVTECENPWASISAGKLPKIIPHVENDEKPQHTFTEIEIVGFYDNDGSHFQADEIEDYIRWFTKWGSFENRIKVALKSQDDVILHTGKLREAPTGCITLDAPGATTPRKIPFGHPFPDCGTHPVTPNVKMEDIITSIDKLKYDQMIDKLDKTKRNHWRYITRVGTLKEVPDVCWEAIISVEGEEAKRAYNPYLRQRVSSEKFSYKAESRYGLWFCKDFFCIEPKNPVAMEVLEKEGQRTRFQILLNCQNFILNNDRNSVGGSDANVIHGIESVAKKLVEEMVNDDSWTWANIIETEAEIRTSERQDGLNLQDRSKKADKKPQIAITDSLTYLQPETEAETVLLLENLANSFPDEFGVFKPYDWRTDGGIDCLVKSFDPGGTYKFVEFKRDLTGGRFNHTFKYIDYVVCWQVKATEGTALVDPAKKTRVLRKHSVDKYDLPQTAPWTLEGDQQTIKVFSIKDILIDKHGVHF